MGAGGGTDWPAGALGSVKIDLHLLWGAGCVLLFLFGCCLVIQVGSLCENSYS